MPTPPPAILDRPLSYADRLALRDLSDVSLLVIHCTELPDLATARAYGERVHYEDGTGASGHYYVDRDGQVECWVPVERVAHHVRGHNAHTVGIELVNLGRYPHWHASTSQTMTEPYPPAQIDALLALIARLRDRLPGLAAIAGHESLDTAMLPASDDPARTVPRKLDPGPLFPWARVLAESKLERITG